MRILHPNYFFVSVFSQPESCAEAKTSTCTSEIVFVDLGRGRGRGRGVRVGGDDGDDHGGEGYEDDEDV